MTDFVRGEFKDSNLYAHKKYKINKSVLDIIKKETGQEDEDIDLMNHQIEQLMQNVYSGKYTHLNKKLSETDKEKLLIELKNVSPTSALSYKDKEDDIIKKFESISNFLKENFNEEENEDYIKYCIDNFYIPDQIVNGMQYSTEDITNFLNIYGVDMLMGFVIIKDYMNHAINILDEIDDNYDNYNKKTLMSNESLSKKYYNLKKSIKDENFIFKYENNDILVIATDDIDSLKQLKKKININDSLIPKSYFKWGETEFDSTNLTLREKLNEPFERMEKLKEEKSKEEKSDINNNQEESNLENNETEINYNNIPPNIPYKSIYYTENPMDILLHGATYGGIFDIMDDFSSFTLSHNNKIINENFDTVGGFDITKLVKNEDLTDEFYRCKKDGYMDSVNATILYGFKGEINLYIGVKNNDNDKYTWIDPSKVDYDIYYSKYIADNFDKNPIINIIVDINGDFEKSEELNKNLYKKFK